MAAEIRRRDSQDAGGICASMRPRRMAAEITPFVQVHNEPAPASMRPRRMAAEIGVQHGRRRLGAGAASMRPRRMAAEIAGAGRRRRRAGKASMRPRRMAAEILDLTPRDLPAARASMRPRRMAAEIIRPTASAASSAWRFNEAAANGRGNRWRPCAPPPGRPASMRPRRMAAEIRVVHERGPEPGQASMRPRRMAAEIRRPAHHGPAGAARFNEAAANGRGNLGSADGGFGGHGASMRPRRMAAEILPRCRSTGSSARASMRPRRMAAEIGGSGGGSSGVAWLQ